MAKKTFKIGEVCIGGIIEVQTNLKTVTIINKEWDYSKGSNKGSSQVNAKELTRCVVEIANKNAYQEAQRYLQELTTSYYTEQILEWCEDNSKLEKKHFWN